jgi:hypothetical protein
MSNLGDILREALNENEKGPQRELEQALKLPEIQALIRALEFQTNCFDWDCSPAAKQVAIEDARTALKNVDI